MKSCDMLNIYKKVQERLRLVSIDAASDWNEYQKQYQSCWWRISGVSQTEIGSRGGHFVRQICVAFRLGSLALHVIHHPQPSSSSWSCLHSTMRLSIIRCERLVDERMHGDNDVYGAGKWSWCQSSQQLRRGPFHFDMIDCNESWRGDDVIIIGEDDGCSLSKKKIDFFNRPFAWEISFFCCDFPFELGNLWFRNLYNKNVIMDPFWIKCIEYL